MGSATFRASNSTLPKQGFERRSPQWRHTLRSLSPDCSRTVSPRPGTFSPFRRARATGATRKHATPAAGPISRPQGFSPQPNPLLHLGVSAELQLDAPLGFILQEVPDRRALHSEERRAEGSAEDRCGHVPAHEARARSSIPPVVPPNLSRCIGLSVAPYLDDRVPHCGATSRCASLHDAPFPDAPKRIQSRRPFSSAFRVPPPGQKRHRFGLPFGLRPSGQVRQGSIDRP
jgi:hypothetical protein